jgi:hypothetical protein
MIVQRMRIVGSISKVCPRSFICAGTEYDVNRTKDKFNKIMDTEEIDDTDRTGPVGEQFKQLKPTRYRWFCKEVGKCIFSHSPRQ